MKISKKLFEAFRENAEKNTVELVSVGLGYTAVTVSGGGIGLAYTFLDSEHGCSVVDKDADFEGKSCLDLLPHIEEGPPVYRAMALALINALNHRDALVLKEDRKNDLLFDALDIGDSTRVAMVGHFGPLMPKLRERGAQVEVVDIQHGIGDPEAFKEKLRTWAQAVIVTSTSILNDTIDGILENIAPDAKAALLGPSTPLIAAPFENTPVKILAGTVPREQEPILKAVRHGKGTPALQKFSLKACLLL